MAEGWIKLHRSIQDNWLWNEEPFTKGQAWVDLILLANHEDRKIAYKGEIVICKRGTINRSIKSLSERWKWGREKTSMFLKLLQSDGMILLNATTNRTTITLINYDNFQDVPATNPTTNPTTNRQRIDTNKNDKNDKKVLYRPKFNSFEQHEYDFKEIEESITKNV